MSKMHADIDLSTRLLSRTPQHCPTVAGIDAVCPCRLPFNCRAVPQVGEGCGGVPGSGGRHCFIPIPIPIFYDCNGRQQWQFMGDKIGAKVDMDKRSSQGPSPTQGAGPHEEKLGK